MSQTPDKPPNPPTQPPDPPLEVLGELCGIPARVYEVINGANGQHKVVIELDLLEPGVSPTAIRVPSWLRARRVREDLRCLWAKTDLRIDARRPVATVPKAPETLTFVYKCRRCGNLTDGLSTGAALAEKYLSDIAFFGETHPDKCDIRALSTHCPVLHICYDGGKGLADLAGARPS